MANKEDELEAKLEDIIEEREHKLNIPEELPVLMLRDIVVFPYMVGLLGFSSQARQN